MLIDINYNPEELVFNPEKYDDPDFIDSLSENLRSLHLKDIIGRHTLGVYEYWDFNNPILDNYDFKESDEIKMDNGSTYYESYGYGVCDDYQQIFERDENIQSYINDTHKKFIILMTYVPKSIQPEDGGWRWHKWGEYIGDQKPTTEYLYDEPEIEGVFTYRILEVIEK